MSPAFFTFLLALLAIPGVDLAGLKSSELIIERVTGPPPAKSKYLSEDSGAKVRRVDRRSSPGLFIILNVTRQLPDSSVVSIKLYQRNNNAYKSVLMEYKKSLCYYLSRESRPILRTLKEVLKFPSACPVKPAVFKVDNWNLSEMIPPTLPISDGFKLELIMYFEKDDNFIVNVFLRVRRRY